MSVFADLVNFPLGFYWILVLRPDIRFPKSRIFSKFGPDFFISIIRPDIKQSLCICKIFVKRI